ncbi:uncharacterized protein JCM15063_006047 [Sporobolomyces koalae]|uniref:uncharacterized protein n=1 Tax=Sporobolomyces koalae TaxID=500713 RepID=UPI00317D336B
MGMWSRTYVCCAVPLYNAGIYCILAQFLIISLVTGVLCFASPSIITITTPTIITYVLGALSLVVSAWQSVGFFGVYRDKVSLFKLYARTNTILVGLDLLLALAIVILSAVKHNSAINQCQLLFSSDATDTTGQDICNVWTWVQVGIMGLLFVIVALCELYFIMYSSIYSSEQKLDHARYNSVYSTAAEEIRQSGLWDGAGYNPATNDLHPPPQRGVAGHGRNPSGLRNELVSYDQSREYFDQYPPEEDEYVGEEKHEQQFGQRRQAGQEDYDQGTYVSGYEPTMGARYHHDQGFQPPLNDTSHELPPRRY